MNGPIDDDPETEQDETEFDDTDYCEICGYPYDECECELADEWIHDDDELPPQWEGGE